GWSRIAHAPRLLSQVPAYRSAGSAPTPPCSVRLPAAEEAQTPRSPAVCHQSSFESDEILQGSSVRRARRREVFHAFLAAGDSTAGARHAAAVSHGSSLQRSAKLQIRP